MQKLNWMIRGGSRTDATSKMELFVIIVNGWKPLTIITKSSILDVAVALDPPLMTLPLQIQKKRKTGEKWEMGETLRRNSRNTRENRTNTRGNMRKHHGKR